MSAARSTILYADDDPDFRLLAQLALEESRLGFDLRFAEDGEELLDYLREEGKFRWTLCPPPDIIFIDLSISKKDGREIIDEIRADHNLRHIAIVVLTTSATQEEIYRRSELRADAFVSKPLTAEGLRATVQALEEGCPRPGHSSL